MYIKKVLKKISVVDLSLKTGYSQFSFFVISIVLFKICFFPQSTPLIADTLGTAS